MNKPILITHERLQVAALPARQLSLKHITYNTKCFSDGETLCHLNTNEPLVGKKIILLFTFLQGREAPSINDQLFILILLVQDLVQENPLSIDLVLPYVPYGRTKQKMLDLILLFKNLGIRKVIGCDFHTESWLQTTPFVYHYSCTDLWVQALQEHLDKEFLKKAVIVSPDHGGTGRAHALAQSLKLDTGYLHKERNTQGIISINGMNGDVKNKSIILRDDILDTGATALHAAKFLRDCGAKEVIGCFTHAVASQGNTLQLVESNLFSKIMITDSLEFSRLIIPDEMTVISIYDKLKDSIQSIILDEEKSYAHESSL